MTTDPYSHWNEEAPLIRAAENDPESPMSDMSDEAIKQAVYDRGYDALDDPEGW